MTKNKTRLNEKYEKEVLPNLRKEMGNINVMAVPIISKIVVNLGVGQAAKNKETFEVLKKDLAQITGQFPQIRPAKISVATFNVRRGMPVGLRVTLRGEKMYSFLDKIVSIVLPRLRDFRGVTVKSFDKDGNYTLGFSEHTIFPEVDFAKAAPAHGIEVTIVVKKASPDSAKKLLELLGMPFAKENSDGGRGVSERKSS